MTTATMTPMMTLLLRTIRATMASMTAAVTMMMTAMMTGEGMKRCVGVSLLYSDFSYQRTISKALWLILVPPLALQLAVNTDGPGHYLASKNELSSPGWPDILTCKGCPCVFVLFGICLLANLVQKMSANRLKKGWSILCVCCLFAYFLVVLFTSSSSSPLRKGESSQAGAFSTLGRAKQFGMFE